MEKQTTILVVDRDPDQLRATADTLRGAGYQVFCTDTSRAALETAHKIIPDVLLVDVSLPDPHGVDICDQMRSDPSLAETKVVRMGQPTQATADIVPGPDCAADSCLTRPVAPQLLRATVRTMVRLKRAEEQLRNTDQLWRTLFDGSPDATLLVDEDLRIVESNLKAAELFHYLAVELKNVPLLQLCSEETQSALSSRLELSPEGQAVVFQTELRRRNNSAFPAELKTRRFQIDASSYYEIIVRDLDADSDFASHTMAGDHDRWTEYSWDEGNPVTAAL